jgi:hypothetical protein
MHLKWDHRRAQTGDVNALSPENLSAVRRRMSLSAKPEPPFLNCPILLRICGAGEGI